MCTACPLAACADQFVDLWEEQKLQTLSGNFILRKALYT